MFWWSTGEWIKPEAPDVLEGENADEYKFISELEKGTSQALGLATSDRIDKNIKSNKSILSLLGADLLFTIIPSMFALAVVWAYAGAYSHQAVCL